MTTQRWRVIGTKLEERETDYTGEFLATNLDSGAQVTISLQQKTGEPASDLIGACRALARLFEITATGDEGDTDDTQVARLN
jgi:hypothetical protein